jgi:polar amino acid transport system substrate-binding protein
MTEVMTTGRRALFARGMVAPLLLSPALLASAPNLARAQAPAKSRLADIVARGKLVVATYSSAPPFCFTDDKGQLVGFDIDIAKLIAVGLFNDPNKIEFNIVTGETRWAAVESGLADFGIASTTIFADRLLRVSFTQPYLDVGFSALVKKGLGIKTIEDLNQSKYTISILNSPSAVARAKRFFPNAQTMAFDTISALFLAVRSGRAQAASIDSGVIDYYVAQYKDELEALPGYLGPVVNNAIYLKQGDFTLWNYLDGMVNEMRHGSLYEQYSEAYKKWFGKDAPASKPYLK